MTVVSVPVPEALFTMPRGTSALTATPFEKTKFMFENKYQ